MVQISFRGTKHTEKCKNGISAIKFETMNQIKRSIEHCTREMYGFQSPKVPIVQILFRGTKNAEKCKNGISAIKFEPMNQIKRSIERCTREMYGFQSPKVPIVQISFRGTKNATKCKRCSVSPQSAKAAFQLKF
jgi:hypothetical protein